MKIRLDGHGLVLACLGALAGLLAVWLAWPAGHSTRWVAIALGLALLPLLLLLPALLARRRTGYAWAGFLSLAYFAQGITESLVNLHDVIAMLEVVLSLLLFASAVLALRQQRRNRVQ